VIDLVCKTLVDPGDVIVAEAPTYPGAVPTFSAYQAHVEQIEMDADGMQIDQLEATLDRLAATLERRRGLGRRAIHWRCFLQFRVRGLIGGLDLRDAILERLVVRARLGELIVHSERQLSVTLLEIELRHRFVDETLRTRAAERGLLFPWFNALGGAGFSALRLSGLSALRYSGFNALRNTGFNALRRGDVRRWRPGIESIFVIRSRALCARQRQHWRLPRKTLGANWLGRFRLSTAQAFCPHLLVLPVSLQTLRTYPHVGDAWVEWLDGIVPLEAGGWCSVRNCR